MSTETKFIIGFGVLTVVLVIVGAVLLGRQKPPETNVDTAKVSQEVLVGAAHTKGEATASVKIVEFGDFQCPSCAAAEPILKKILSDYPSKIYFVFRNYPLPIHNNSKTAAQAAEAASDQGKYWEMHDKIYENQTIWAESKDAQNIFEGYAKDLNLDMQKYKNDFGNDKNRIAEDYALGNKLGVDSTPTFFINGTKVVGIQQNQLLQIINSAK